MAKNRVLGNAIMSKRNDTALIEQLDLDLPAPVQDRRSECVVRFVDRETRLLRQEAIEHVRRAGIFELPKRRLG